MKRGNGRTGSGSRCWWIEALCLIDIDGRHIANVIIVGCQRRVNVTFVTVTAYLGKTHHRACFGGCSFLVVHFVYAF